MHRERTLMETAPTSPSRIGPAARRLVPLLALLVTALILSLAPGYIGEPARPNIVLIMADDIGYEALGANGGTSYATPNLDALAAGGMRFTQAHATPLCTPSRVQLMTGKYGFRN